ncbi:hypothetical protein BH11MYX2_BH11MYX2_00940 [soil metagenome]
MRWVAVVLALGACGRVGFDPLPVTSDGSTPDIRPPDTIAPLGTPDLWFKLDEAAGTTLRDDGPLGMDATITGTFLFTGTALRITAPDTEAVTAHITGFRHVPLTMSAWVTPALRGDRTSAVYGHEPFPPNAVSTDIPNSDGMGLGVNVWSDGAAGSQLTVGGGGVANDAPTTRTFAVGTRYHVVVVYSTAGVDAYVDGALAGSVSPVDFDDDQTAPLHIGVHNADNNYLTKRYFVGDLDDIRVYKLAATPAQIALLHAAGPE